MNQRDGVLTTVGRGDEERKMVPRAGGTDGVEASLGLSKIPGGLPSAFFIFPPNLSLSSVSSVCLLLCLEKLSHLKVI